MLFVLWILVNLLAPAVSQGPIVAVQAVKRTAAHLPCDMSPPIPNDTVTLVVWYKNDIKPIYSVDRRGKSPETGIHWKNDAILEERSYFRIGTEPPTLTIDNVEERDEAIYRCRVDFKTSPTRNYKINLTVIVPPQRPKIFDEGGRELTSVAGPYEEGSEMKLTCVVSGGRPEPWVRWWRDETLVDSSDTIAGYPNVKKNQLVISRLSREHLNSVFTCQASNNNISQPVSTSLTVEIHFKPMNVSIITEMQPMSANRKYKIVCVSIGSRPPAKISWWRDNELLTSVSEKISDDENVTTSTLAFTPSNDDNGGRLTCRADNPRVNGAAQEVTWKLDVHYMPHVRLELGSKMNPEDIEEGDDVYFECKVKANPGAYKVLWKHNNQIIQQSIKGGVILSHKALALQSVRRTQAGNYTCVASNVEGDGDSNTVQLKVMYKPICRSDQKHVFGVARNEDARVMCEVDAFPAPDSFRWSFNNSAEAIEIAASKFHNSLHLSLSTLSYTPQTEMDYGTVMCWASNTAGQQREPCVFHIIAAGRPDPPYNCTLINQTLHSLDLECLDGFDGGQVQNFQLEVYNFETNYLLVNSTSKQPVFKVEGLNPGVNVKINIYAFNSKGKSDIVSLDGFTLKIAEKQTGTPVPFYVTPVVVVLVVATVMLMTCIVVIFGVLKARNRAHVTTESTSNRLNEKTKVPLRIDAREIYDMDDNNPDLIPCNKDSDYQLVANSSLHSGNLKMAQERGSSQSQMLHENVKDSNLLNVDIYENYKNVHHNKEQGEDNYFEDQCLRRLNSGDVAASSILKREIASNVFSENDLNRCNLSPSGLPTHREVITVRTPLMANQQESCV
ncbi:nephrin isoform X2 [Halyomorpha halys]|uniref:nephrin isoform X2 n=1 Tax=Halyomorpha halys TaxID=286706 RepID=UPI0006D4E6EB